MNNTSISETVSAKAQERLVERFAMLEISAPVVAYPTHATAEEGKALRGDLSGTFTKNLLLKDKKGRLFLITFHEDRALNLKILHTLIGANGRLGFAPAERMETLLGVSPGALTPLGIINDMEGLVTVVIDAVLLDSAQINFHPLVQEESVGLTPAELLAFIRSFGREPLVVQLGPMTA
ncbi:prolyl-tRNA synthetase associated domain-containing protein [Ochrobactrum sp. RH2CCR150]|uniref:prolyl-tRNA synthetase associated domain-containing protein n=1 Tax=Ochrobactrum sp. RH2CCR150 TaxID=2587044 RepID=UPI00185BF231|nr:Ala-tRNA(Pro) deacylase [Ochrobactrum sp. RH2CCR150]